VGLKELKLRIGESVDYAAAELSDFGENRVLSVRKRVHRPTDSHANQQKQKQRPRDILHALNRLPPAQETKSDGNQQREKQHGLQMTELESRFRIHALRPRAAS
jgi:hypothetical protein